MTPIPGNNVTVRPFSGGATVMKKMKMQSDNFDWSTLPPDPWTVEQMRWSETPAIEDMPMTSHTTPHDDENIEMSATLGTVITGGRDRLGITQREAADRLGIDETYLSKLEHDESKPPSDRVLTAFAHLYAIDDDLLFCLAGKVPPDLRQDVTSYGVVKRLRVMLVRSLLTDEAAEIWPLARLHEAQS